MNTEARLRTYLAEKAGALDVAGQPIPVAGTPIRSNRMTVTLVATAAALVLVGFPLLVLSLVSDRPTTPADPVPVVSVTTTTVTVHTMVPPMDDPAMARFYAIAGLDQRSDPEGILLAYTRGPEPLDPPSDVVEQALQPPSLTAPEPGLATALEDMQIGEDRLSPILITGINHISGAVGIAWVEPDEASGQPSFCAGVVADNAATWNCGEPGLTVQDPEPPYTPSRYTLSMTGFTVYTESGIELPITIGSARLPLETAYVVLVGPNGERWMQRPISGTALIAVDVDDPVGIYEMYAYDRGSKELAVGFYAVSPEQGADADACQPPMRTDPLRTHIHAALELSGVVVPSNWVGELEGPHARLMPNASELAELAAFECAWNLTGYDGLNESTAIAVAWSGDRLLAVMRTTFVPVPLPQPVEVIDVLSVGPVTGEWLSDDVFAGTVGGDDVVIFIRRGGAPVPTP